MLSLAWTMQGVAVADPAGFAQHCSGFAQDPLLRALWLDTPEPGVETRSTDLTAMVPRLSLRGTALATYEPRHIGQEFGELRMRGAEPAPRFRRQECAERLGHHFWNREHVHRPWLNAVA